MYYSGQRARYINNACHDNLNIGVILSCVASYCYAFFNILRSFRVCVHACVFVHAYESGRNYIHACNKKFFLGYNVSGKRTPLRRKLATGLTSSCMMLVSVRCQRSLS